MSIYDSLQEAVSGQVVVNTHSHYQVPDGPRTLDGLFMNSYVKWLNVPLGNTQAERAEFLEVVRHNTYFLWLERSLQRLYGFSEKLTAKNWDAWSEAITQTGLSDKAILREICGYQAVILDAYWDPGADHGKKLFTPTFRINSFLCGHSETAQDHNGNNALKLYGETPETFDEYLVFMRRIVKEKKAAGCVAIKCASAYDRSLDFQKVTKARAQKAYRAKGASKSDIKAFQDYVFFELCQIAAEENLPFQMHTGLGLIDRTNALVLREAIAENPGTRFMLFHGGYPWMDDIAAMAHFFPNVYVDLCWLPLISTGAAERFLHEMLDVTTADKLMWGCDTWTPQESYGALLAMREVTCRVLVKRIERGETDLEDAKALIGRILYRNAAKLYKVGE